MDRVGVGAAVCALAGAGGILVASAATGTGYGYVSEAGVAGAPFSGWYRAGVFAVAAALALLAAALRPHLGAWTDAETGTGQAASLRRTLERISGTTAVASLAVAAPLAATSGAVPCTTGCPLPPYEKASHQDIAHAVASIGGFGLAALAMLVIAVSPPAVTGLRGAMAGGAGRLGTANRLRTASRLGAGLAIPLLAGAGLAMLVVGRGLLAGVLERAALAASLGWLVAATVIVATTRPSPGASSSAGEPAAIRRRT